MQIVAMIIYRPYAHSGMYGFVVFLYLSSCFGCAIGFLVVLLHDPDIEYPVFMLYGSWVLSAVVGLPPPIKTIRR